MISGELGKLKNARCRQEWKCLWGKTHEHCGQSGTSGDILEGGLAALSQIKNIDNIT